MADDVGGRAVLSVGFGVILEVVVIPLESEEGKVFAPVRGVWHSVEELLRRGFDRFLNDNDGEDRVDPL